MNVNREGLARFSAHSKEWWQLDGHFKILHRVNPIRMEWINAQARLHFGRSTAPLDGLSVLDLGCGGGILAESLAREGASVTAIDLSEPLIAIAKQHAAMQSLTIDYQALSAEDLLARGQRFDLICCMEVLEHVPNPNQLMQTMAELLRPGGLLVISTLNRTPIALLLVIVCAQRVLRIIPKETHAYQRFITPSEVAEMLAPQGFKVLARSGLRYNPFSQSASLSRTLAVNYLMALRAPS